MCHKEKGCACKFVEARPGYKVCPACKKKLDGLQPKNEDREPEPKQPNIQGV